MRFHNRPGDRGRWPHLRHSWALAVAVPDPEPSHQGPSTRSQASGSTRCGTRVVVAAESAAHPAYIGAIIKARRTRYASTCTSGLPALPVESWCAWVRHSGGQKVGGDVVGEFEFACQKMAIAKFQGVPTPVKGMSGHVEAMCCLRGSVLGRCAWTPARSSDSRRVDPGAG